MRVGNGDRLREMLLKIAERDAESRMKLPGRFRLSIEPLEHGTEQSGGSGKILAVGHALQLQKRSPYPAETGYVHTPPGLRKQFGVCLKHAEKIAFSRFVELIVAESRRNDDQNAGSALQRAERTFHPAASADDQQHFAAAMLMERHGSLRGAMPVRIGKIRKRDGASAHFGDPVRMRTSSCL